MSTIKELDTIVLAYTGLLDNGEIFIDQPEGVTIPLGQNELPPTVENALIGMAPGETRTVKVAPEEGYGMRHKDLLQTISRSKLPPSITPKPGMILGLNVVKDGVNIQVPATVMAIEGEMVTVDYNHPLAGHNLTYKLRPLRIVSAV
ncbi:MAG: FKBP-type peptidyl-prolyl cis-trans isomerase [Desulfobulbaceae bacterium]|jgi:FKBP-type peptidyl-prolyl cis-trans isomerase 2|nr:FKBP-type peptidyl-prolyl cis-trans isomerase [Desulfobulbaceae bacterium]